MKGFLQQGQLSAITAEYEVALVCCEKQELPPWVVIIYGKKDSRVSVHARIVPMARGFGLRMTVWLVTVDDSLRDQLDLDAILTVVDAKHCLQHIKRENKPEKVNEVWPLIDNFTVHAYVCRN